MKIPDIYLHLKSVDRQELFVKMKKNVDVNFFLSKRLKNINSGSCRQLSIPVTYLCTLRKNEKNQEILLFLIFPVFF